MSDLLQEFKDFIKQGNLLELAIGLIIALKVKDIIDSLVKDIINPIIGAIFGKPDFGTLTLKIGKGVITYGNFINAVINFVIVAAILFLIMKAYTSMQKKDDAAGKSEPSEKDVLVEIRDLLASK